jgi:hypothetical protein
LKSIKVILNHFDVGTGILLGYLIDGHENALVFAGNDVWLCRVKLVGNELYDIVRVAMLGEAKDSNNIEYANQIIRKLQKTSVYDFIVQKFFYGQEEINFDIT